MPVIEQPHVLRTPSLLTLKKGDHEGTVNFTDEFTRDAVAQIAERSYRAKEISKQLGPRIGEEDGGIGMAIEIRVDPVQLRHRSGPSSVRMRQVESGAKGLPGRYAIAWIVNGSGDDLRFGAHAHQQFVRLNLRHGRGDADRRDQQSWSGVQAVRRHGPALRPR